MKSTFVRKASLGIFLALSLSPSTHAREMIEVIEEQAQKVPLSVTHTLKLPLHFFQKLTYSQRSLTNFLEEVYNHKRYAQDFLALNFLHPLSGLELASNSKHPRQFACKILRLFDPKLHHIFINPYAVSIFLEQSMPLLAPLSNLKQERAHSIKAVKDCIGSALITHFKQLRLNPDLTLTELAEQVIETLEAKDDCSVRELQHAIHHFLSQVFSCLIWDPTDEESWEIIKTLMHQLTAYEDNSLIDHAMLDNILWTLVHQVSYYLLLTPQDIPSTIFDQIRADLDDQTSPLLAPEREAHITTKLTFLAQAVMEAEVVARAHSLGYILPS